MKFSKDSDGQFLRDLFVSGIDFSKKRKVDFYFVVPTSKRVHKKDTPYRAIRSVIVHFGLTRLLLKLLHLWVEQVP